MQANQAALAKLLVDFNVSLCAHTKTFIVIVNSICPVLQSQLLELTHNKTLKGNVSVVR
jgi:hypothetical protein